MRERSPEPTDQVRDRRELPLPITSLPHLLAESALDPDEADEPEMAGTDPVVDGDELAAFALAPSWPQEGELDTGDALTSAYRAACSAALACAADNERRLRDTRTTVSRIIRAAERAAVDAIERAEQDNARRLSRLQRRLAEIFYAADSGLEPDELTATCARLVEELAELRGPLRGDAEAQPVHPSLDPTDTSAGAGGATLTAAAGFPPNQQVAVDPLPARPFSPPEGPPSGSVAVVAGPFARFSELVAFTAAVRELPGVESVAARQFYQKMAHFLVRYRHAVPLATRLSDLRQFRPEVVSSSPTQVEVYLTTEEPAGSDQTLTRGLARTTTAL